MPVRPPLGGGEILAGVGLAKMANFAKQGERERGFPAEGDYDPRGKRKCKKFPEGA